MEFLERLRKKPAHVRARVAFGTAVSITALIGVVWSTTLPPRLTTIQGVLEEEGSEQSATVQNGFDALIEGATNNIEALPRPEEESEPSVQNGTPTLEDLQGGTLNEDNSVSQEAEVTGTMGNVILIGTTTKNSQ